MIPLFYVALIVGFIIGYGISCLIRWVIFMINISFYSDLHTEFDKGYHFIPEFDPSVDVIIFAGDCFVSGRSYSWLNKMLVEHRETPFIIFVPGNHDYYNNTISEFDEHMIKMKEMFPNFFFLNNKSLKVDDVVFHGSPLWTTFEAYGPTYEIACKKQARLCLNDFIMINRKEGGITSAEMEFMGKQCQSFLKKSLAINEEGKNVVITHFPPLIECTNPKYPVNSLSPYFNNDLTELVKSSDCDLWIYGHNHYNMDFELHGTRFISNQRGYVKHKENVGKEFNPKMRIEI